MAVLALLTALNLFNYLDRLVLSAVLPRIEDQFALSHAASGLLGTIFLVGYFATSPLFGHLADQGGRRGLLAVGIGVWSLATIASGFSRNFVELALARALVGVGEASYVTIAPTLIDDLAPPGRKGSWLAIFYSAMPIGVALGYITGGSVDKIYGWRAAFFVAGTPGILLSLLCLLIVEPQRTLPASRPSALASWRALAASPLYVRGVLGYAMFTFAVGGFGFWGPAYLFRHYRLNLAGANKVMGLVTVLGGAIGTAIGGVWADRATRGLPTKERDDDQESRALAFLRVCAIGSVLAAPLGALAILAPTSKLFIVFFFLCETAIFLSTSPINAVILETVPSEIRATAMAVSIFAIHALGDLWSPAGVGVLADHLPMHVAMLVLPGALALSAVAWWTRPLGVGAHGGARERLEHEP
jgi:MFS family permease